MTAAKPMSTMVDIEVRLDDEDLLRAVHDIEGALDDDDASRFESRLIGALASALPWLPGGAETFLRAVETAADADR